MQFTGQCEEKCKAMSVVHFPFTVGLQEMYFDSSVYLINVEELTIKLILTVFSHH